jgi:hypothetical protein
VDWINLAQIKIQWTALVSMETNFGFHGRRDIFFLTEVLFGIIKFLDFVHRSVF